MRKFDSTPCTTAATRSSPIPVSIDGLGRGVSRPSAPRRVQKLWAFLLRRGFPAELVGARLRALWPRWADALLDLPPLDPDPDQGAERS